MARKRKPVHVGLFDLRCEECGHYLVAAGDGNYLACPNGHGKLHTEQPADLPDAEPSGLWCEDDLPGESRHAGWLPDEAPEFDVQGGL